ncbi:MAG: hypothetical protein AAGG75_09870 [Bacteroidota bacterium]
MKQKTLKLSSALMLVLLLIGTIASRAPLSAEATPENRIPTTTSNSMMHAEAIWPAVWEFVRKVGYSVIVSVVGEYVKEWIDDTFFRQEVIDTNQGLSDRGYGDLEDSPVVGKGDKVFYPAHHSRRNGDLLMPFFNRSLHGDKLVAVLKLPCIMALIDAADYMEKEGYRSEAIAGLLIPEEPIQGAVGSTKYGFSRKEIYLSNRGKVRIDYQSNGNGVGEFCYQVLRDKKVVLSRCREIGYNW